MEITVVDDAGNQAGVTHDVTDGTIDVSAGVSSTDVAATLPVGALSNPHYSGGIVIETSTVTAAKVVAAGTVTVGGFALMAETTGSADGGVSREEYIQPVPVTEPVWEGEVDGLEITLPSGAAFEHELHDGHERRHGWEQLTELPGIDHPDDVGEVIEDSPGVIDDGQYDLVIGDNPGAPGEIGLWAYEGMLVFGAQIVEDPTGKQVEIDRTDDHAIRDDDDHISDWDLIEEVVRTPDQIYQNGPNRLYVKQIDGKWYTVRAFEHADGVVTIGTSVIYDTRSQLENFLEGKGYPESPIYESD